jgi:hypothetical protein
MIHGTSLAVPRRTFRTAMVVWMAQAPISVIVRQGSEVCPIAT